MVDVTTQNFSDIFKQIKEEIPRCTFVAIDAEFTGLLQGQERDNRYDTPDERYTRHRELGNDFMINQMGICLVEETCEGFAARPYNFYLYPIETHNVPRRDDSCFLCQASSLKLLGQSGFDFNKWIKGGIRYVSEKKGELMAKWKAPLQPPVKESPSMLKSPVKTLKGMARNGDQESFVDQIRRDLLTFVHDKDSKEMKIKTRNRFERKVIYTLIEEDATISKTPILAEKALDDGREVEMLVKKASREEVTISQNEKEGKRQEKEELKLGFTRVVQLLLESGKLLVLHNGLLDLMNIYRQFMGPLPENYQHFKEAISSRFGQIMDTKLMATSGPFVNKFNSTRLEELFSSLVGSADSTFERVSVHLPEGFSRYSNGKSLCHEAGYDAYMTAVCFIHMMHHMRKLVASGNESTDGPSDPMLAVAPFKNRIAMGYCDVEYIDFHGNDPVPPRNNLFCLTFPSTVRASDIIELFGPFSPVDIQWIDDTHAYVSPKSNHRSEDCYKYVHEGGQLVNITVQRYRDYRADLYTSDVSENSNQDALENELPSLLRSKRSPPQEGPSPATKKAHSEGSSVGLSSDMSVPAKENKTENLFSEPDSW